MARYMVATHRAAIERDWLCKECGAFGTVTVDAVGTAEKRVWLSKTAATDVAHERAHEALHADADRIIAIVRCPTCRTRARGLLGAAVSIVRDLIVAGFVGLIAGAIMFALTKSEAYGVAMGVLGMIAGIVFGQELRRRNAAADARVKLAPKPAPRPAVEPVRAPIAADADPFRTPPAPPPIAVIKPQVATDAPRAQGEPGDQPAFLS